MNHDHDGNLLTARGSLDRSGIWIAPYAQELPSPELYVALTHV